VLLEVEVLDGAVEEFFFRGHGLVRISIQLNFCFSIEEYEVERNACLR
jgi:hypothetical protein